MATLAHSTRTPLLRQTTGSAGLLPVSLPAGRIVAAGGPVTRALAVMAGADPGLARIRNLRRSIAERIQADLALLDALDGDPEQEATALEHFGAGFVRSGHDDDEDGHDAEGNTDDNGIADIGGAGEAGFCGFSYGYDDSARLLGGSGA